MKNNFIFGRTNLLQHLGCCIFCLAGRSINRVDIRPFINNLPFGRDTSTFSTQDASGSTSQAANIIEGLEVGSKCLLIDEVTSYIFIVYPHSPKM